MNPGAARFGYAEGMPSPSLLLRIVLCLSLALNGVAAALASAQMHDCCEGASMAMDMHAGHDKQAAHATSACACAGLHACVCGLPAESATLAKMPSRDGIASASTDAYPAPGLANLLRPPIDQA